MRCEAGSLEKKPEKQQLVEIGLRLKLRKTEGKQRWKAKAPKALAD